LVVVPLISVTVSVIPGCPLPLGNGGYGVQLEGRFRNRDITYSLPNNYEKSWKEVRMSDIRICDKCGTIFAAKTVGSSRITQGIVYKADGTTANLQGDLCDICTTELTSTKIVKAIPPTPLPDEDFTSAPVFDSAAYAGDDD
jgi:hypothetical protein